VRYELNKIHLKSRPKSPAMPQAVSRGPRTADIRVRSQPRGLESCRRENGTRTDFSPSTSDFPCQCQCCLLIFNYMFLLRGQTGKTWEPSTRMCSFPPKIEERCIEKHSKCLCYSYINRMWLC